jgi:hypothetical protein
MEVYAELRTGDRHIRRAVDRESPKLAPLVTLRCRRNAPGDGPMRRDALASGTPASGVALLLGVARGVDGRLPQQMLA